MNSSSREMDRMPAWDRGPVPSGVLAVLVAGMTILTGAAGASAETGTESAIALEDLAWMAGSWKGESKGTSMEEIWTDPKGGLMLGLHRDVSPSGRAMFEYLRIVQDEAGIAYLASPMGRPPTRFPLVSVDAKAKRAVFENLEHDFPQRIIYWLGDDGKLHARIEGDQGGQTGAMEWAWSRSE